MARRTHGREPPTLKFMPGSAHPPGRRALLGEQRLHLEMEQGLEAWLAPALAKFFLNGFREVSDCLLEELPSEHS